MKIRRVAVAGLSLGAFATACLADEASSKPSAAQLATVQPPKYSRLRWEEDYSYLKDPANRTDWLDPLKYIAIDDASDSYASLGGQTRVRYEFFNNNNFGAGPQDDNGYYLTRVFLHSDVHLTPYFRAFVEGKTAMEDGREGGPRPSDSDEADLQQFFTDFNLPMEGKQSMTVRLGRQDLLYGVQRLVAPGDWGNTRRTFEGGKFIYNSPVDTMEAFWVRPVVNENEEPNTGDGNVSFSGVYNTTRIEQLFGPKAHSKIEVYGFSLNESPASSGSDQDTYTVGSHFSTVPRPWDFDVEACYQFGNSGGGEISAWAFDTEAGYTFVSLSYTPRAFIGFDISSGDRNPNDPDKQTFNQLFALGHSSYGYADVIGKQNALDLHPGIELSLLENVRYAKSLVFRTDYHIFWRESDEDGVYNKSGGLFRADNGSNAAFIGSELDFLMTWHFDRHTSFYAGYSHVFAGEFIQQTGASEDIDFVYAAVTFMF